LSSWGYRAFAIDIPKNGNQTFPITEDKEAVQWLTKLLHILRLSNVVIVSPSRSGKLSLPYIFQLNEQQQLIRGYVPIDPIGASHYHADDFKQIKVNRIF
jgi:abhydrolase domain-containing protein 14